MPNKIEQDMRKFFKEMANTTPAKKQKTFIDMLSYLKRLKKNGGEQ